MTEAEARNILGIETGTDSARRHTAYDRQRAMLEEKLGRAPTPGLKAKYRGALERITAAYELLELEEDGGDLPSLRSSAMKSEDVLSLEVPNVPEIALEGGKTARETGNGVDRTSPQVLAMWLLLALLLSGVSAWVWKQANEPGQAYAEDRVELTVRQIEEALKVQNWENALIEIGKLEAFSPGDHRSSAYRKTVVEGRKKEEYTSSLDRIALLPSGGDPPQRLPLPVPPTSPFEALWRPRNFSIAAASITVPLANAGKEPYGDTKVHIKSGRVMIEGDMVILSLTREASAVSRKGRTFKDGRKELYGLHEERWLLNKDHLAAQMKSRKDDGANEGLRAAESLGLTTLQKTGWFLASPTSGKSQIKDGTWGIEVLTIESYNPVVLGINIANHGGFLINTELGGVYGYGGGLALNGLFFKLLDETP